MIERKKEIRKKGEKEKKRVNIERKKKGCREEAARPDWHDDNQNETKANFSLFWWLRGDWLHIQEAEAIEHMHKNPAKSRKKNSQSGSLGHQNLTRVTLVVFQEKAIPVHQMEIWSPPRTCLILIAPRLTTKCSCIYGAVHLSRFHQFQSETRIKDYLNTFRIRIRKIFDDMISNKTHTCV